MQGVALRQMRRRCGWIACALLLLAPWLLRWALAQTPTEPGAAITAILSFNAHGNDNATEGIEPDDPGLGQQTEPNENMSPPMVRLGPIIPANKAQRRNVRPSKPAAEAAPVQPVQQILHFVKEPDQPAKPSVAARVADEPAKPVDQVLSFVKEVGPDVSADQVLSFVKDVGADVKPADQVIHFVKEPGSQPAAKSPTPPATTTPPANTTSQVHLPDVTTPEPRPFRGKILAVKAIEPGVSASPASPAVAATAPPASAPSVASAAPPTVTPISPPVTQVYLPSTSAALPAAELPSQNLAALPAELPAEPIIAQLFFVDGFSSDVSAAIVDPSVVPTGCSSCGGGGGGGLINPYYSGGHVGMPGGCRSCGAGGNCIPLKRPCSPCLANTKTGKFLCCVYECICCPDPCYDPRWIPVADAAFFVDAPRPQTQQRYRWDAGNNLIFPDRNEYFWAQANGFGIGPLPTTPFRGEKRVDYNELSLYTEVATGLIGFFAEMPYRTIDPELAKSAAGFSDINLGTKSLLYDCELFQLTFQFKTYIMSGNFFKGLGAGHVTIEPSIILGVRLGPETYAVTQVGEWIPFGNPFYDGSILRANYSLNQVIYHVLPDVPLLGTLELTSWSFQSGNYTDPYLGTQRSSGTTYVNVGPGLRLVICDKLDFGIGTSFSVTKQHWAQQLIRSEFRYRF